VTQYTDPVHTAGPITHHFTTDWFGNTLTADADCCQKLTAAYTATTQYAYPDSVTRGISPTLQTRYTWNANTGQLATVTDENTQGTTYSYDLMKRLKSVQGPLNQQTAYTYVDSLTPPSTITAGTALQSGATNNQVTYMDGLGRAIEGRTEDAANTVYSIVDTQYDPVGRVYQVSNPYTSTPYWTQTRYDALGRTTYVIPPDGSANSNNTNYSYSGSKVTVTDPTGKQKLQQSDALGRLASVYEPDVTNNNSLTVQTSYTYDVGNRLTGVSQGSQTRAYVYDGLGRQTSVTTPETGNQAFQYQYNNYSLLTQRTDARGVVTTYGYDSLNRPYQVSYNVGSTGVPATATVTMSYGSNSSQNNNGRLITMSDGTGSESYAYDQLGRVTQLQKTVGGVAYTIGYGYNYASQLTSITYPSGRQITQTLDGIGRLTQIAGSLNSVNTTYASAFGYNPAAEVTGFNYGNGVAAAFTYDSNRLLLQSLAYSKGGTNLFSLSSYGYAQNGGNNGQITSITDAVDSGRSAAYTYDALGRLSTAVTQGSAGYAQWGLSWTYDRYGNRTAQTVTAGTAPPSSLSFDVTKNQINSTGYTYDKNGNLTVEPLSSNYNYTYDAENRLVAFASGGGSGIYAFDGHSLRVQKTTGGATTVYIFAGSSVIAEYASGAAPSAPTREYIYSGSLLAKEESGTEYYLRDHLSVRVMTDSNGNKIGEQGHFPFGESWYQNNTTTKWFFTSYERDSESGNDYATFRYYGNRQGRFLIPDPLGVGSVDPGTPQMWNAYAYVGNNPVGLIDPTGLCDKDCQLAHSDDAFFPDLGYLGTCFMEEMPMPCGFVWWLVQSGAAYPVSLGGAPCYQAQNGNVFCGWNEGDRVPFDPSMFNPSPGVSLRFVGDAANNGKKSCLSSGALTAYERAMLVASQFWASMLGRTVGFGLGASGSINPMTGIPVPSVNAGTGGGISNMLVTDTSGNSALVTTYTYIALNFANHGGAIQGGVMVLLGNQQLTPGWSGSLSGSISGGPGLGATMSADSNGTFTLNAGVGLGARASGGPSEMNFSNTKLICE